MRQEGMNGMEKDLTVLLKDMTAIINELSRVDLNVKYGRLSVSEREDFKRWLNRLQELSEEDIVKKCRKFQVM